MRAYACGLLKYPGAKRCDPEPILDLRKNRPEGAASREGNRPILFAPARLFSRVALYGSIFENKYAPPLRKAAVSANSTAASIAALNCQVWINAPRSPSTP